MKILAIETSTNICSVCLAKDYTIIDYKEQTIPNSHSKYLPLLVNDIIKINKIEFNQIDCIALSIGPGSYTGLKVGSSFAKGLTFMQNRKIIPINTIHSLNSEIDDNSNYYIAIYSHRDYVFYQEFLKGKEIGNQFCKSVDKLKKIKIYGYGLEKIDNIEFIECKPSSINLIHYINKNKSALFTNNYIDICPIYLIAGK